ncbi:diguanylate cyclase [Rheinheimera sp.]|uniref:ligand-binding sensor domain-containing diguanylate cyclase n=1 Tax=Rheinheimera sp. TaxID=1869214 RepID=UPI00307EB205
MRYWLALCYAFCSFWLSAQPSSIYDFDIKHWTSADGLSSNSVRAISQDQQGYIWVGTSYGLNRFDGQQFVTYSSKTIRQLPSNAINQLLLDSSGYLWIGTKAGLAGVNPASLKFERFPVLSEVTSIVQVAEQEIWLAADNLFRVKQGKVSRIDLIKEPVVQLKKAGDYVWATTAHHLHRIGPDNKVLTISLPQQLQQHPIYDLLWTGRSLHLASESGYFHLNENMQLEVCPEPHTDSSPVYTLFRDSRGNDWVSSYNSLYYRQTKGQWQRINSDELSSSPWFSDVFEDNEQNIWLASFSEGLFRASPGNIRRVTGQGQQDAIVRSVRYSATHQGLLIATQNSVGLLNPELKFQPWLNEQQLQNRNVYDFAEFRQQLWLGTDKGLLSFSPATASLQHPFAELADTQLRVVQASRAGGLWVGGATGLFHYDGRQLQAAAFNAQLESNFVTVIEDTEPGLYVGTTGGLYWYAQQKLTRVGVGTSLYGAYITGVLTLPDARLVVATLDDGLFVRSKAGFWRQFSSSTGLPQEPVVSLLFDAKTDLLWASSLKGIFRVKSAELDGPDTQPPPFEQILTPYDRQLGAAPGRCCNGSGHSKVALWQDQLWYPSLKGLVAVPLNLKSLSDKTLKPLLQSVQGHQVYLIQPDQSRLVLALSDRNISLYYSALEFRKANEVEFRYRLNGFDQQWQYAGQRREAIYTNLPPGTYSFELQARYSGQSWSADQQQQLELVVPRLFNETLVYQGLWLLLVLLMLYGFAWLWRRKTLQQQQELSKLVRQRTSELQSSNERLYELNDQLQQLTHKDALTGLRNRRFLFEQLPKDAEQYQQNRETLLLQGKCMALLHLDLDHFKQINDMHGNSVGDAVLQQVSALLLRESRGADYVVRYAGEQFVLVLRDVQQNAVADYARQWNQKLASHLFQTPDGQALTLTCSIGYACFPLDLLGGQLISWETSLQLAEIAGKRVKLSGRNGNACLSFDAQVDAFEFEDAGHIEQLVEKLLADGMAWFELYSYRP